MNLIESRINDIAVENDNCFQIGSQCDWICYCRTIFCKNTKSLPKRF